MNAGVRRTGPARPGLAAFFLVGPTAVGKTTVGQRLAEQDGGGILSADSMLVYRGMDVGTAKPSLAERGAAPYAGIDLAAPDEAFSVAAYRRHALETLRRAAAAGRRTLVVGGTGLYVKALTHGLAPLPPADPAVRARWAAHHRAHGVEGLQAALRERAPALWAALDDPRNPRRLLRALELHAAGVAASPTGWDAPRPAAPLVGLRRSAADLKSRIELRVSAMYRQGLIDEVARLLDRYGALAPAARKAIGYEEAIAVLRGACGEEEARVRTAARTRRLARRQATWFRNQADVRWIDVGADDPAERVAAAVRKEWETHGATAIADG